METVTDSKREEIIEAAARLFMQRGYEATSVRDLARAAGVSQATLYYYIGSKPQVLVALHNSYIDGLLQRLSAVLRADWPAAAKLRDFISITMDSLEHNRTRMAAFMRERRSLSPEAAAEIQVKWDQVDRILEQILQEGIESGAFRRAPVKSARLAVLGMIAWGVEWLDINGPCTAQQFAADFTDLVLHGLASGGNAADGAACRCLPACLCPSR